jgi:site-specific recombinase
MVSNPDQSRSGDRENLPLEGTIDLQSFSEELAYITQCLQNQRELQQLVSACSSCLVEDGLIYKLSIRHICLLLDIYVSNSEYCWEEIQVRVTRLQKTVEDSTGITM